MLLVARSGKNALDGLLENRVVEGVGLHNQPACGLHWDLHFCQSNLIQGAGKDVQRMSLGYKLLRNAFIKLPSLLPEGGSIFHQVLQHLKDQIGD